MHYSGHTFIVNTLSRNESLDGYKNQLMFLRTVETLAGNNFQVAFAGNINLSVGGLKLTPRR